MGFDLSVLWLRSSIAEKKKLINVGRSGSMLSMQYNLIISTREFDFGITKLMSQDFVKGTYLLT